MKKLILFSLAVVLLQSCSDIEDKYAYEDKYTIDWNAAADSSTNALIAQFWNAEGNYFNYGSNSSNTGFQYWPNAHAMDVVIDAYIRTSDNTYKAYFDKWYAGVKIKNGNTYLNEFYDDMEWNALTILRMYNVTNDAKYLTTAKELFTDIATGWNDLAGGGIAWRKAQPNSKNACSNGPAAILAARLFNATNDVSYKTWAINIYDWEKNTLFNRSTGAVYDNIDANSSVISSVTLTYNQGTFLGAALELYDITKEATYLNDAKKSANYTLAKCIDTSNNILKNEGDSDNALFKGIFIRYFVQFILNDDLDAAFKKKYSTFLNNNAQTLWISGNYSQYRLFGPTWNVPPVGEVQLTAQASACMLIEAKAFFDKSKK